MPISSRKFSRTSKESKYRKLFLLVGEGKKTEQGYFAYFNGKPLYPVTIRYPSRDKKSAPEYVLKKMKQQLEKEELRKDDEAWLVVDKDQYTDQQLNQLSAWAKENEHYHLALSNPCFELWLLLHFEDAKKISSPKGCGDKLKKYLPNYDKGISSAHHSHLSPHIDVAIDRAKQRDKPPCCDWPRTPGLTTVYKLVENILKTADPLA